jgi:hypothetical protein
MKAAGHKKEDEASRANQMSSLTSSSKTTNQSIFKLSSNQQRDILSEEDNSNGTKGGCVTFRNEIFQEKRDSAMNSKQKPQAPKERQELTPGGRRNRTNSIFHIGRNDYEPFKPSLFLLDMNNSYGKKYADDDELSTGYGCEIESSQRKEGNCLSFENTLDTDKLREQPRLSDLKRGGEKSDELPILESATEKESSNLCSREAQKTSTPSNKRKTLVEPEFTFQPKILKKSKEIASRLVDRRVNEGEIDGPAYEGSSEVFNVDGQVDVEKYAWSERVR